MVKKNKNKLQSIMVINTEWLTATVNFNASNIFLQMLASEIQFG